MIKCIIKKDKKLTSDFTQTEAVDYLWATLSVRNWAHLRHDCHWSQKTYIRHMKMTLEKVLVG